MKKTLALEAHWASEMTGLYIHIPFCKKACHYCDFHFSTNLKYRGEMLIALCTELSSKATEFNNAPAILDSLYFGGGTPSILNMEEWSELWKCIHQHYELKPKAEITLEANPDDLTEENLRYLSSTPINRLSIGIQSFRDEDLLWMNRAHNAEDAISALGKARQFGFKHFSLDLIYGIPGMSDEVWIQNIKIALSQGVNHISAYSLTVEEGTALHHFISQGKSAATDDEQSSSQYRILCAMLKEEGFLHYEVSNFAQPGHEAVHNSGYWSGMHYVGIGPSAHSYDGKTRSWNVSNNAKYMKAILQGSTACETEVCTDQSLYNEAVLTGLRRKSGLNIEHLKQRFGKDIKQDFKAEMEEYIGSKWLMEKDGVLVPTDEGMLWSDRMSSSLFITD